MSFVRWVNRTVAPGAVLFDIAGPSYPNRYLNGDYHGNLTLN